MNVSHYTRDELVALGISCGENVRVDRSVVLINPQFITLGHDVRIDCFCVLSASEHGLEIGSWVHIACGCYLFGGSGQIVIEDFSNLSSRVSLFTANDDYTEGYLTNPLVPGEYRRVATGSVVLRRHAIVGAGSVLLPGVTIGLGGAVGALSLIRESTAEFAIVAGTPGRRIGTRGEQLLELEKQVRERHNAGA